MPTIKNVFTGGKMSRDVDERLLKKGEYRYAKNIRIANSEGSDVGAIEKSLSNRQLTGLNLGTNVKTIGGVADEFEEKLYWLVKSDLGCFIIEYNTINQLPSFVLKDTRIGDENVLALDENYLVTGIAIIVDTDNNNRFLIYTDNNTQPKFINIERAKTYGENGFDEEMILLIKKPPIDAPKIELTNTRDNNENNIEEKFLRFGYRYKYLDGQYSAISPLSEIAFKPRGFRYNYDTDSNESMINQYNRVKINFDTGSKLVTDIEILFVENGKNIPYLIEKYNKKHRNWGNNTTQFHYFDNNEIYKNLPENQLFRLYDNVPIKAKSLDVIDNRIVFANYTENYDLIDENGHKINPSISLRNYYYYKETGSPFKSCKSNRDYEIAIAYIDDYGRMTTPITSLKNHTQIPAENSITQNYFLSSIRHKPPYWAKYYRIFIKQSKRGYETISPFIFFKEGNYLWLRLEKSEIDKIKEGDYLIVKTDTVSVKKSLQKVKVLEIKSFEKDKDIQGGVYFKIESTGLQVSKEHMKVSKFESYFKSYGKQNPIKNTHVNQIFPPAFYGSGNNDLTISNSSNYTGTSDKRFSVEISSVATSSQSADAFKVTEQLSSQTVMNETIIVPGENYTIEGITFSFEQSTGHILGDKWVISAKSSLVVNPYDWNDKNDGDHYSYGFFKIDGDEINGGSSIKFIYIQTNTNPKQHIDTTFTSSRKYNNIEEWYYGDQIQNKFDTMGIPAHTVYFRRGVLASSRERGNIIYKGHYETVIWLSADDDPREDQYITMIIRSTADEDNNADGSPVTWTHITVSQFISLMCFETEPKEENSDVFYEIGRTYKIENGYHLGYDSKDISASEGSFAVLRIPFYNCYAWGNGFESIKIKDEFNANTLSIQTRPSVSVENYRKNTRIASLTYGKQYDQSLNYNGLNEFNMSELNFKDLDDKYGAIQRIMTYNTDLDVWQEDKVHRVLYGKSTLYNEDGSSNVGKSNMILGTVVPYAGEFGISTHPESLVAFGNYRYWADAKRGVIVRKGQSGIEIISKHGMRDWFRDFLGKNYRKPIFGAYDPYYKQYTISLEVDDRVVIPYLFDERERTEKNKTEPYIYYFNLNNLTGDIQLDYNILKGKATIMLDYGGEIALTENVSGVGNLSVHRNDFKHDKVKVTITPITDSIDFTFKNINPTGENLEIISVFLSDVADNGKKSEYLYNFNKGKRVNKFDITFTNDYWTYKSELQLIKKDSSPLSGQEIFIGAINRNEYPPIEKLGYYVTDENLLSDAGITELLSKATFPTMITIHNPLIGLIFNYEKPAHKNKLYLIWDYRTP